MKFLVARGVNADGSIRYEIIEFTVHDAMAILREACDVAKRLEREVGSGGDGI